MKVKTIWVLVLMLVLGGALAASPARAQVTIGVSPSIVELSVPAGGEGSVDLSVNAESAEPFDATVEVVPLDDRVDSSLSVPEWLTVSQSSITLEPGQSAVITVTIKVPEDQPSGARYAGVAITIGGGDAEGTTAAISGRLLVPLLMIVEGEGGIERTAEVERFAPVLELDGRLGFRALVRGTGNVHVSASGLAIVTLEDGADYGTLDFVQTRVYPGRAALLSTTTTLPVQAGTAFNASAEVEYGADDPATADTAFAFTPDLAVSGSVCENLDRGPTITTELINDGTLGVVTTLQLAVGLPDGGRIGESNPMEPQIAWPSDTSTFSADLPERLPTGDYVLTVSALTGASADPIVQEIPFSIGGTGPNVAPICPQPESTPDTD
jgi:hypothetical protein